MLALNTLRALSPAIRTLPRFLTPAFATTVGHAVVVWRRRWCGTMCGHDSDQATGGNTSHASVGAGAGELSGCVNGVREVEVQWGDGGRSSYPHVWLRENCQCSQCFNPSAIARLFLMEDLSIDIQPKHVEVAGGDLVVVWDDGHTSRFSGPWLLQRSFTPEAREEQRSRYKLPMVPWGSDLDVPLVGYRAAMEEDAALLEWAVLMERYGVVQVHSAPPQVGVINRFIERVAFIKPTHYGRDYDLITHLSRSTINLAYTGSKLGLHTDLPYCQDAPGTTWLHCIRQHEGQGGDNDLSDGVAAAEELRQRYPHHFNALVTMPIYFQDKGYHLYQFDKIARRATIALASTGEVEQIYLSSQSRDSLMDLDSDQVYRFYAALKVFGDILRERSVRVKMKPGEILVIDNTRVLHGRQPFQTSMSSGTRHVHNSYVDMDEVRSKRRVLQDKLGVSFP